MAAVVVALAVVLGLGLLAGCGSDGDDAAATTTEAREAGGPLSEDDAARLAQVLFRNGRDGGATVAAGADYSAELSVALAGTIDFAGHRGVLTVTTTSAGGGAPAVEEVAFEQDAVYERAPADVAARLAAAGRPGIEWVRRPPAQDQRPIDQVIALLVSLSTTRPDNPQLLAQQDLAYARTEEVAGQQADVFTAEATGASYWVAVDEVRLLRFQGTIAGFAGPLVVDLSDPGPVELDLPAPEATVDAAEVPAS